MQNTIEIAGLIDTKGNLQIYDNNKLKSFCNKNKNKTVVITVRSFEKSASKAYIGYYQHKILPSIQKELLNQGVVKSIKNIDEELRQSCPITIREKHNDSGTIEKSTIQINELEQWQLVVFIDYWLYSHLLDNLNITIHNTAIL